MHPPRSTTVTPHVPTPAATSQVLVPASIVVKAGSSADVDVRYRPLLVGSNEAVLKLESGELGLYEWGLRLGGAATNPERSLTFNVPLGGREGQLFRFTHWLDDKADYKVSFKSSGTNTATGGTFTAPPSVAAPPAPLGGAAGAEVTLEVTFEPTAIGESIRDTLVLTSATGGEYHCPLLGRCIPPKPQGPVDVSKGSAALPFTNVFPADAEFQMAVDNPAFVVKPVEKIGAKKAANIAIAFKPPAEGGKGGKGKDKDAPPPEPPTPLSRTGKLTISCPAQTSVQWVYYLQA